jgi:hypothetical protein
MQRKFRETRLFGGFFFAVREDLQGNARAPSTSFRVQSTNGSARPAAGNAAQRFHALPA